MPAKARKKELLLGTFSMLLAISTSVLVVIIYNKAEALLNVLPTREGKVIVFIVYMVFVVAMIGTIVEAIGWAGKYLGLRSKRVSS